MEIMVSAEIKHTNGTREDSRINKHTKMITT